MTLVLEPVNGLRVIPLGLGGAEVSNLADISLAEYEMPQTDSC